MGIKNLLPFVQKACRPGNVTEFKNKTVAVDVSCLLHRSFTGCVHAIANGERSVVYINFIRRYIDLLLKQGCHVILVFDGQPLPAKSDVNSRRSEGRAQNRELGKIAQQNGDHAQAFKYLQMCTGITEDIVTHTIEEFRTINNVDIIVAPYEADAQLAFLSKSGIVDAVVTEDSDLIPFGCDTIIFKLSLDESCVVYDKRKLSKCVHRGLSTNFNFAVFRRLCIVSGCDYFPEGIPRVGLKKAVDVFSRSVHANDFARIVTLLKKIPRYLDLKNLTITDKMIKSFIEAEYTFLHQIVFDPITRTQKPLFEYPTSIPPDVGTYLKSDKDDYFWFAGKPLSAEDSFRRAIGNMNLKAADNFIVLNPPSWSIYHPDRLKHIIENEALLKLMEEDEDIFAVQYKENSSSLDSGYSSNQSQKIVSCEDSDGFVPATPEYDESIPSLDENTYIGSSDVSIEKVEVVRTPTEPKRSMTFPSVSHSTSTSLNTSYSHSITSIKKEIKPIRNFASKSPIQKKVIIVSSVNGPSAQKNEMIKPRPDSNNKFTFYKTPKAADVSPRGIKRPLSEVSVSESNAKINCSFEKRTSTPSFTRLNSSDPENFFTKPSSKPKNFSGFSPRLSKNTFPSVEFPKKNA